jgi:hypothetical protein
MAITLVKVVFWAMIVFFAVQANESPIFFFIRNELPDPLNCIEHENWPKMVENQN